MNIGSQILLLSHENPSYYPSNAYALWTFMYIPAIDNEDIQYQISFVYLRIRSNDFLKIGYGWDPNNTTLLISSYEDYYGYPKDVYATANDIFVEFDANPPDESYGVQLNIKVHNISGKVL